MSRHTIGEKVVVVCYEIEGQRIGWKNPMFKPWDDKLKRLHLEVLTVTEAHRVAWDQDPDQELKYDGFLLVDSKQQSWANQYPSYGQGQISTADAYFTRRFPDDTKYEDLTSLEMVNFEDVRTVLSRVHDGVKDLKDIAPLKSMQLQVHLDWLMKKVEKETGAKVEFKPIWAECPDIVCAELVWPVEVAV